jgi:NAD(P)H-dependent flavin oxidoreductase YrpB (nitropropane dioxygenase family)
VSNAGGLGILGGVDREPDELIAEVGRIRALTDRPFGVNLVLAKCSAEQWEACFSLRPSLINTSWGDAAVITDRAHALGCRVLHQVNTTAGAAAAVAAGVDLIAAQGSDGGGHVGSVSTLALVPQVVDVAGEIPVVAAGGIADGRGVAAALALGAEGVLVGTRFLATFEAAITDGWKAALLASPAERAVISDIPDLVWGTDWPGATGRVLRNRLIAEWEAATAADVTERAAEIATAIDAARVAGDLDFVPLWAGQGVGLLREVVSAAEVVRALVAEAEVVLRERLPRFVPGDHEGALATASASGKAVNRV